MSTDNFCNHRVDELVVPTQLLYFDTHAGITLLHVQGPGCVFMMAQIWYHLSLAGIKHIIRSFFFHPSQPSYYAFQSLVILVLLGVCCIRLAIMNFKRINKTTMGMLTVFIVNYNFVYYGLKYIDDDFMVNNWLAPVSFAFRQYLLSFYFVHYSKEKANVSAFDMHTHTICFIVCCV